MSAMSAGEMGPRYYILYFRVVVQPLVAEEQSLGLGTDCERERERDRRWR